MMGEVTARCVGPAALCLKWPLLPGSGWSCAWAGGQLCSIYPTCFSPLSSIVTGPPPASLWDGWSWEAIGWICALCQQEQGRDREETAQEKPFCCVQPPFSAQPTQQRPTGSWICGNQTLLYLFVVFIKPRNGPDENRKGEQAPLRRRFSRGRKPQQEAVSGICSWVRD